ncbi:MAG: CBS domain-containing protein [Candidatus Dadabacteria bacterium]|nr:CBS domain-containing protein [Candidatus Dadabacteria bacterium]
MLVKNCMTPNPLIVTPGEDVKNAFHLLKKHSIRQIPVLKDERLVGIVTDRDLRMALVRPELTVGDVMSSNPMTIIEDAPVEEAARMIRNRKFNALPVVSKRGELVGIITVTDIFDGLLNLLRFHEEPTRVQVKIPEGVSLVDVIRVFQVCTEKVLSFSSSRESSDTYYLWVIGCDFDKLDRKLKEKKFDVSVNYLEKLTDVKH